MAEETEQQAIDMPVAEMTKLNTVSAIREWWEPGVYFVDCNVTIPGMGAVDRRHCLRPDDDSELSQQMRAWMEENSGFSITPYAPPTDEEKRQVMPPLTARQFRLGMLKGITEPGQDPIRITPDQVTAAINGMPEGDSKEAARIEWEHAGSFSRMHPLIASISAAFGLTDQQIDAMWTVATNL